MEFGQTLETHTGSYGFGSEDMEHEAGEEMEKLESEVKLMAQKILHYRAIFPDQLKSTFVSILSAQRPIGVDESDPGTSGAPDQQGGVEQLVSSRDREVSGVVDKDVKAKVNLLKAKISSNVSLLPAVMKRIKDCISTIDKLDSCNGFIHPPFKRRKSS